MRVPDGTRTADYDYDLPPDRVAQFPLDRRDQSRLMVVDRATGRIEHRRFPAIAELVRPGDALVVNTTRVFRARLLGRRDSGAPAEVLLLRPLPGGEGRWEAMVSPGGKLRPGRRVTFADDFTAEVLEMTERHTRVVRLVSTEGTIPDAIERHGHVPLPPYIARADERADEERYQTVYARESGSVAAPTAGLHFTPELLDELAARGVRLAHVVLHVGAGTFKPVEVDDPSAHVMHEEAWSLETSAAEALNATRGEQRCIWAVGTTSVRALESAVGAGGTFRAGAGETSIFIRPPYRMQAVDKLVTNFHLPRSTLIMLVAAMAGYELTMEAYRVAVQEGYRFYSYGDAMAIV